MSSQVGTLLSGRYRLDAQIGSGGMSTVFRAFDTVLERQVAIKLMHREIAGDSDQLERFRREARAVAQLNHPHVVGVIDAGEEGDPHYPTPYIVFEFVEGETLKERIRRHVRLPVSESIAYAIEIARALGAAHERQIVHRDVKPQNVLIDEEGSAKVTDFGIARSLDEEGLTADGRVLGTTDYVSPEQALGHEVNGQSDIYSLGVVLFEMLTGEPPFSGDTPVAVAYKHVREAAPRPSDRVLDVPPDLDTIVVSAMEKDLDVRYQSADDLRDDLVRFGRGKPPSAAPVTAAVAELPTGAGASRTEAMPSAAAATHGGPPDDDYYTPPPRRWGTIIAGVLGLALLAGVIVYLLVGAGDSNNGGATRVDVPNVVGMSFDDARLTLVAEGFRVRRVDETSSQPANEVLRQEPGRGQRLEEGGRITLFVSEAEVEVPSNLVGQQCAAAVQALQPIGLAGQCQDEDSDQPPGTVLRTEPPAGSRVPKAGTVTLIQARQPQVAIPDVANQPAAAAKELLEQVGFVVTTANEPNTIIEAGRATRTEPPAGTMGTKGDALTMFISTGPQRVDVPNTVGQIREDAQNLLVISGFNVIVQPMVTPDPTEANRVISQSPNGGQADQGTTVTIVVGQSP
jgi:beta-lactam-binding protein with PASTA domain/tRNA A-37 threonylcarbamoyl transferase component Bud32